jgi:hypothetical protein
LVTKAEYRIPLRGYRFNREGEMKIPTTGKECPFFYGDYHRGRNFEECRLIIDSDNPWEIKLCQSCPIPDIVRANSCPNMVLSGEIKSGFLGINRRVRVAAYCTKTHREVQDPYTGCGECHPIIDLFKEA